MKKVNQFFKAVEPSIESVANIDDEIEATICLANYGLTLNAKV